MHVSFTYYDESETAFDVRADLFIDMPDARSYSVHFDEIVGPNGKEMSEETFSAHEDELSDRAVEEAKNEVRRHSRRGSRFRY